MSAPPAKGGDKKHRDVGGERKEASKAMSTDPRFAGKARDARFAPIKRKHMKVKVDARFKDMFTDKRFIMPHTVDKYGRPAKQSTADDMRRFYRLEKDENEAKEAEEPAVAAEEQEADGDQDVEAQVDVDGAEGDALEQGGAGEEERESSEESSDESESSSIEGEEEEEGVLDEQEDIPVGDETKRLAVLNLDWEHLRAVDLLVLFNSCLPSSGEILSLTIYPSQFGLQMMAKEAIEGPPKEIWKKGEKRVESDENETFSKIQLRKYELSKLKYYFAVIDCDSVATASALYAACDGIELERTSNVIDLRFVPDEEAFTQKPRDVATEVPSEYRPPSFATKALQHTNVDLTWDGDDATRDVLKAGQWAKGTAEETELQTYLASSSDEYEEGAADDRKGKTEETIAKYKKLLEEVTPKPVEEENMEITFMPGLSEKAEELVQRRLEEKEHKGETVWERHLREKKARKAERRRLAALQTERGDEGEEFFDWTTQKDGDDEDVEADDGDTKKKRKGKKEKARRLTPEEEQERQRQMAELELLVMDDEKSKRVDGNEGEEEAADHKSGRKLSKKKQKALKEANSTFKVNLQDGRFAALVENDAYAIDRTNPLFKETPNMQAIMGAKRKKALEREMQEEQRAKARITGATNSTQSGEGKAKKADPALAQLVASVKRKSETAGGKRRRDVE